MNWETTTLDILSLPVRIVIGVLIFAALALADFIKHGSNARRWREYLFLVAVLLVAMLYGALNDQISSRISWEYFYYGKELCKVLGPDTPPEPAALHWQAALVGMKASWSVGLLIGAALLLANNPRHNLPSLPFEKLALRVLIILPLAIIFSAIFGLLGWNGWLNRCSVDFEELATTNLWRPPHFIACWGEHMGAYVGGGIGAAAATISVAFRRNKSGGNAGN